MQPDLLTKVQRRDIAGALYDLGNGAFQVSKLSNTLSPSKTSPLAMLLDQSLPAETWGRAGQLEEAVRNGFLRPVINGFDHFDAYATAIRSDRALSMSLATLARGALEAWGRAWWIFQAPSSLELQIRRHKLTMAELKYQVRLEPTSLFSYPDQHGVQGAVTALEYQERIAEVLIKLNPGVSQKAPSYTDLATEFLAEFEDENARKAYSQLSAVAHGESIGTTAFARQVEHHSERKIDYDPRLLRFEYGLPMELGLGYAKNLASAIILITESTLTWWGMPADVADQWEQHRWRACERLDEMGRKHATALSD